MFVIEAVRFDTIEQMKKWNWDWVKQHEANKKSYIELYKLVIAGTTV
jgi:hypothetical protein